MRPDVERCDEPDPVLALPADVEQAAAEGEGDRERGEDERRGLPEGLLEVASGCVACVPSPTAGTS